MKLRLGGTERVGRHLDLRSTDIEPSRLVAAIRNPEGDLLESPTPGAVHRHVGHLRCGMTVDIREGMIAAARTLGFTPPQATEIEELDARIADISSASPDLEAARKRVATAGESVDALRERVATLRGRIEATIDLGEDPGELREALEAATKSLSEAETERIAAEQALERAEANARRVRDARAKRLSLVDRRDNRRREAREWLIEAARPRFETALGSLPVPSLEVAQVGEYRGRPVEAALGIARMARIRAPIVLGGGPIEEPLRARAALGAPVLVV